MRLLLIEHAESPFLLPVKAAAHDAGLAVDRRDPGSTEAAEPPEDTDTIVGIGPGADETLSIACRVRGAAPDVPLVVFVPARAGGDGRLAQTRSLGAQYRWETVVLGNRDDVAGHLREFAGRVSRSLEHRDAVAQMSRQLTGMASHRRDARAQMAAGPAPAIDADYYLTGILAQASDAIVSTDARGVILTWNSAAERLFGYPPDVAIGEPVDFLNPDTSSGSDSVRTLGDLAARVLSLQVPEQQDAECRRSDGRTIDVAASIAPIRDTAGALFGLSIIARDVSERRRIEEALREANRQKDEFLATISHELRTPLTAIVGYTDMLLSGLGGSLSPRASGYVSNVRGAGERLRGLVDALLDYTRLEAKTYRVRCEPVDLVAVARRALQPIEPQIAAKGLTAAIEMRDARGEVLADEDKARQIVGHYLSNAIKFTPPGGHIDLKIGADPDEPSMTRLTVRDTGIGLEPTQLERVWDRFYQVDQSLTREHGGMGLGLAIVWHLADLHHGRVGVRSAGLGAGAEFWVSLPRAT